MFFVKAGLRAPFISSRVGLLVQRGPHTLCCLNGGPKILRGPCRTMIEAQIYIIVSAYTTPKAFWFKGGNSPFAFSIEGLNF